MSVFKPYDIRGIYGPGFDETFAAKLGHALGIFFNKGTAVVGYDMRLSSKTMFDALCRGLSSQGCKVINIGLCSTPMNYFANGFLQSDFSVMVTASHNPGHWNGFKICRTDANPLSYKQGLKEIQDIMNSLEDTEYPAAENITDYDIIPAYRDKLKKFIHFTKPPRIVVDYANAMGIMELEAIKDFFEIIGINDHLDGAFPAHEANPLKTNTLKELCQRVVTEKADFGVAYDGDGDRSGFVDEKGNIISMDLSGAMIATEVVTQGNKGTKVLYGARCSHSAKEVVEEAGGIAERVPVGHAFIKNKMRQEELAFGFELSGHYYFKDNFYSESQALALIYVANMLEKKNQEMSEAVKRFHRYYHSGEINIKVEDISAIIRCVEGIYEDGTHDHLDGLTITYPDWWFNLRPSNTEPLLRLVVEAESKQEMERRISEICHLIEHASKI